MKHPLTLLCAIVLASCLVSLRGLSDTGATLRVLQSFPVHVTDKDEDSDSRAARLAEIASAIDAATSDPTERAALLTLGKHESSFARYVMTPGQCHTGPRGSAECDHGKSEGIYQLRPNDKFPEVPADIAGQTVMALRLWRGARVHCRSSVPDEFAGAYSMYGSGNSCGHGWAKARADHLRRIAGRL